MSAVFRLDTFKSLKFVVQCLSSIVGHHKEGLTVLLESDCECSVQVRYIQIS